MRFPWPYAKKNPTRMRVLGLTRDPDIPTGQVCSRKEYSSVVALARINMPRTAAAETESIPGMEEEDVRDVDDVADRLKTIFARPN